MNTLMLQELNQEYPIISRRLERMKFIRSVIHNRVLLQDELGRLDIDEGIKEEIKNFLDRQTIILVMHGMKEGV